MSRRTHVATTDRRRRGLVVLTTGLVALLLGGMLGYLAGTKPGHHPEPTSYDEQESLELADAAASVPGDRVAEAIAAVRRTGLYVGPELRDTLTAAEIAAVERQIADSPVPLFVVYWGRTSEGGYRTDNAALTQIRAHVARDGFYAVIPYGAPPTVASYGYDDVWVDADGRGRPAQALLRMVRDLSEQPATRPSPPSDSGSDYWGGTGGGIAAGLLFAALAYGGVWLVVLVVRAVLRSRRSG